MEIIAYKPSKDILRKIKNHEKWVNSNGGKGKKADFSRSDLKGLDLRGFNLKYANFMGADLSYTDLRKTDLTGANLQNADLSWANLQEGNLQQAELKYATFLRSNLKYTNFYDSKIQDASLDKAKNLDKSLYLYTPLACPEEGSFIGFKKIQIYFKKIGGENYARSAIAKLKITENAKRSSATNRKCRCNEVEVLEIFDTADESIHYNVGYSLIHIPSIEYRVGETIKIDDFDENRWNECSTGIHFFITKQEAIRY